MSRHEENYRGYKIIAQQWKGVIQGRAIAQEETIKSEGFTIEEVVLNLKTSITKNGTPAKEPDQYFVATTNSVSRVFHRPKCFWMSKVSFENEVRFKNKEEAKSKLFHACPDCRP